MEGFYCELTLHCPAQYLIVLYALFAEDDNDEICDITYVEMNRNR